MCKVILRGWLKQMFGRRQTVQLYVNHTQGPRRKSKRYLDVLLNVSRDITFLVAAEISGTPGVFAH